MDLTPDDQEAQGIELVTSTRGEPPEETKRAEAEAWANWKVARMSEEEIATLARRLVQNEVFLTNTKEGMELAFGLLLSALLAKARPEQIEDIAGLWEEMSKAGPRSINGYPFFMSCHYVHREDWSALMGKIKEYRAALGLSLPEEAPR